MNRHQKCPQIIVRNPAYRQAFQRLDEALEENTQLDNIEFMRRMRAEYFADVDELQKSGRIKLPKP
jgi:tetrahydromethanopterin S-methyltransferase subunit G